MKTLKILVSVLLVFALCSAAIAQEKYAPTRENLENREWFRNARFGLFIHWGVYSIMGDAEWVMQNQNIPVSEYEKLPSFFNPVDFSAEEWVTLAKNTGMKYITITTKHHDGFAMYDSKVSDYNIVNSTPYGKDIFRMLEQECSKQGLKLFAYYSQLDWRHPDYFPRGWTGRGTERPESGNWDKYLEYQDAQISELARNYDIAGFWFDGWWDHNADAPEWHRSVKYRIDGNEWYLERTYKMIHDIKPELLIGNNHHVLPFSGEDFQMFEKDLPGENTIGFNYTGISSLPLETCETINGSWGFRLNDRRYKSVKTLVHYLINAAGRDANFLLNVGPMPNGKIQPEFVERLKAMGDWMKNNGETIYGTRGGPFPPADWGVSTQKENRIYLHILDNETKILTLPNPPQSISNAVLFSNKNPVRFTTDEKTGLQIFLPPSRNNDIDLIIEIVLQ
ncbi:alpha-L-fucosidase [candidate division KSB1 bacterium]